MTVFIVIVIVFFSFVFLVILMSSIRLVQQATVKIVERLGKYHKTLQPGLNIIMPFFDKIKTINTRITERDYRGKTILLSIQRSYVDLRERVFDFPSQSVITKDNVILEINAMLYFQIFDPFKSGIRSRRPRNGYRKTHTDNSEKCNRRA